MGWMSWEQFHCSHVDEASYMEQIDHLAADGWLEAGYQYFSIDDCWTAKTRDANGDIQPDPERFPHGMKWLADYAHKKNVKLGIYYDYGVKTCTGYIGLEGHEWADAQTLARWDMDMIKVDGCYSDSLRKGDAYMAFSHFLNATGRPICYMAQWPCNCHDMDRNLLLPYANAWRTGHDIQGTWASVKSIINNLGDNPHWAYFAGPGGWNDADQIVVGCTRTQNRLTPEESRSQMSIWSICACPLMMSVNLKNVTSWAKAILIHDEVIAINQDVLGRPGYRVTPGNENRQIWIRSLSNGDWAVALFNRGDQAADFTLPLSFVRPDLSSAKVRDVWNRLDLGVITGSVSITDVAAHDTKLLRLTRA
jgi:alpha-N-acetylgalactosaminidase